MNQPTKDPSTLRVAWRLLAVGMRNQSSSIFLSLILLLIGTGVALLQPWPVKMVFDNVIGDKAAPLAIGKLALLGILCATSLIIQLISALFGLWSTRMLVSIGLRMVHRLRCRLFDHVQRLSMRFHDITPVGDSVYRVAWDAYCVQAIFNSAFIPAITSIFTLALIISILATRDWLLVVVALGVAMPIWLLVRRLDRPMGERSMELHQRESDLGSSVGETLGGIRAVAAFGREKLESSRFEDRAQKSFLANLRLTRVQTLSQMLVALLVAAAMALVLWIGAYRVVQGKMTAGDVVLIIAYAAMILRPLETLAYTAATMQSAVARGRRVLELLDQEPIIKDGSIDLDARARGDMEFENISFAYRDGQPVLSKLNLKIYPGETLAIVGPSGAGKTTLASLLMRFYDPQSGRILLDGRDLRRLTLRSLRQNIALMMQEHTLFGRTIRENIAYGRKGATTEEIEDAARAAGAHDFISALPDDYETTIGERGATLSGGQRQRIALARAFLKDAPILIMDEPTSALDAQSESDLLDAMERLGTGRTTIIIAHRLSTIRNANRIIVMNQGQIAEIGTHDELLARNGIYSTLHHAQFPASAEAM